MGLGTKKLVMILNVEGIFLFTCEDDYLRKIVFLLNKMVVLSLIGSEHL